MKILMLAAAALLASTAAGAVTFTTATGAPDPGAAPGETIINDFESGMTGPAGIVYGGSYTVDSIDVSGVRAAPAGASGNYFATPGSAQPLPGVATIDFADYIDANRAFRSLSFYWGSVDSYNTLDVLDRAGNVIQTIVGNQVNNPADGNQTSAAANRRLFLRFSNTDDFASLRLTSTQRAFEIDDIAVSAVPETSTWVMLITGLGLVGFASRRRRMERVPA